MRRSPLAAFGPTALALLSVIGAAPVSAADWIVTVGGRGAISPPYEGAPHEVFRPSLLFSARRADRPFRFAPPDDGGSAAIIESKPFELGPVLNFRHSPPGPRPLPGFLHVD